MKLKGGYLPRIAGRPSSKIFEVPVPEKLVISLRQFGLSFDPLVDEGKLIDFGTQLACATIGEGNERYIYIALADGYPLYERIVALGGPGFPKPRHVRVRVGTPLKDIIRGEIGPQGVCILRGGLFIGEIVSDIENESVNFDDDGFSFLPKLEKREMLSFLKPGFRQVSHLPVFMSSLIRAADSEITNSLRGELRPCIACGSCELICPAGLFPNLIHRHLYANDIDEAEKLRVDLCVDCNLCTYICPSKIELQKQFYEAKLQLEEKKNLNL